MTRFGWCLNKTGLPIYSPILDTIFSVWPSVRLSRSRYSPLKSEMVWTGPFWGKILFKRTSQLAWYQPTKLVLRSPSLQGGLWKIKGTPILFRKGPFFNFKSSLSPWRCWSWLYFFIIDLKERKKSLGWSILLGKECVIQHYICCIYFDLA